MLGTNGVGKPVEWNFLCRMDTNGEMLNWAMGWRPAVTGSE